MDRVALKTKALFRPSMFTMAVTLRVRAVFGMSASSAHVKQTGRGPWREGGAVGSKRTRRSRIDGPRGSENKSLVSAIDVYDGGDPKGAGGVRDVGVERARETHRELTAEDGWRRRLKEDEEVAPRWTAWL